MILFFDFCFLIDEIIDLFVGFINNQGQAEESLQNVIMKNFSSSFYLEIFYVFGPLILLDSYNMNALLLFILKLPRFNRLFEVDNAVQCFVDFYGKEWTVFEILVIKKRLEVISFTVQTSIAINLLTCCEIMVCTHRDYSKSWMTVEQIP